MYSTFLVGGGDPQKLIWNDTQGSLTHIVEIFNFRNVSGPRATKWPKLNCRLKIVNYFTCVQHFFSRWWGPPEVDLNWYPRISNPYCRDIQIRRCGWSQGYKMAKGKGVVQWFGAEGSDKGEGAKGCSGGLGQGAGARGWVGVCTS